jgi:hypothetical protein
MQNCYNAGRIPRENLHDQNAKSKAESLQFIKELADQNKLLKKRIEELEVKKIICLIGVPNCPGADLSWYRNVSHRCRSVLVPICPGAEVSSIVDYCKGDTENMSF